MSAAARSAAAATYVRLARGDDIGDGLLDALFLSQSEFDLIARGVPPGAAATLARAELARARKGLA